MRLRISDPTFLTDLVDFLRRADCRADRAADDMLDVELPHEIDEQAARIELGFYVGLWQAMNRGVVVDQVG